MTAEVALDAVIKEAVSVTAGSLADSAQAGSKIGESRPMQPTLYDALTNLGLTAQREIRGLTFKYFQGPAQIKLGGIEGDRTPFFGPVVMRVQGASRLPARS